MLCSCSFTGHRPKDIFGYDHDAWVPLVDKLETLVSDLVTQGVTTFISGGAQGVDQAAFWAVNRVKRKIPTIRNVLYLPFPGFDRKWKDVGVFSRRELALACKIADEVRYISDDNSYSPSKMLDRNQAMIDDSDIVIAVWCKGNYHTCRGGTADAMRRAEAAGKKLVVVDPMFL